MTIHILTVCTGNSSLSPLAAGLLEAKLERTEFEVVSVGTSPLAGEPVQDIVQRLAIRMGAADISNHRATGLSEEAVTQADLILGMERKHRRAAVTLAPHVVRRSFTLLEFAHVISYIGEETIALSKKTQRRRTLEALDSAMRMRGVVPRLRADRLYEIPDPFGRAKPSYERSARQIERAVNQIVPFLTRVAAGQEQHQPFMEQNLRHTRRTTDED